MKLVCEIPNSLLEVGVVDLILHLVRILVEDKEFPVRDVIP
jgi:hypothetical protein